MHGPSAPPHRHRRRVTGPLAAGMSLLLAACGSPAKHGNAGASRVTGTVDVAYAGSLQLLNEKTIGPAFAEATGAGYEGRGGGAIGLSKEIAAGEISPNVFESIGAGPIEALEPKLTRWYVRLAASPIVVAYNPASKYAPELKAIASGRKPLADLFALMEAPGFALGRTNPDTDPQGQAFYEMVELATTTLDLPAGTPRKVLGTLDNPAQVFAETALESRLQAGQLDAASAFRSQAVQLHLPYVSLPASIDFGDPALASSYAEASLALAGGTTVHGVALVVDATVLGRSDRPAATAFLAYLLSPEARAAFRSGGYTLLAPKLYGDAAAAPSQVRHDAGS